MSTLYRSNSPHIRVVLLACALQSACTLALAQPAAPEIQLLVANSGNANLPSALRFDADSGSPRGPLGPPAAKLPGRGAVGIDQPRGVAADAAGNVVVGYRCANCGPDKRSAVFRFDMKTGGAGVTDFIAAAGLDEGFEGLALSPDGKVLVATQAELGLVNHYDGNSGQLLHSFTTVAVPRGATIGPDGKAYVLIHGNRLAAVHRYDLALGTDAGPFVAAGAGGLDTDGGSAGLVFGPNGDLFVTSTGRDQILRYNGINGSFMGCLPTLWMMIARSLWMSRLARWMGIST